MPVKTLKKLFPKGSTVYTILRHVSASGTSRRISVISSLDLAANPDYYVEQLNLAKRHKHKPGLVIEGGGMDMGYHLAHTLARALYGDGYALHHRWL